MIHLVTVRLTGEQWHRARKLGARKTGRGSAAAALEIARFHLEHGRAEFVCGCPGAKEGELLDLTVVDMAGNAITTRTVRA